VFEWPKDGKLRVPLRNQAKSVGTLAGSPARLQVAQESERLVIDLPPVAPDPVDSVVVLEIEGEPAVAPLPSLNAKVTASTAAAGSEAQNAVDGTAARRWRAPADAKSAWLEVDLGQPVAIAGFGIDEPDVWPRMKQKYSLEVQTEGAWQQVAAGSTDGHGARGKMAPVVGRKFRLTMQCDKGAPGVAELQLYRPE
jgi:hypothetical protein